MMAAEFETGRALRQCWYLDVSAELGGESLLLHVLDGSFTSEQVDGHTRRQETLVLLPLQRLKEEEETNISVKMRFGGEAAPSCCAELLPAPAEP